MQGRGRIMKSTRSDRWGFLRGRRGIVLIVGVALAAGLGATGINAVLAEGATSAQDRPSPTVTPEQDMPEAPVAVETPRPTPSPTPAVIQKSTDQDQNALAAGVYGTYVRAVDVQGATVTVDVLQVFAGADARKAAIEDGVPWRDVRYDPVYIRNENEKLRTLPVAGDAYIRFIGGCMEPDLSANLARLREETESFDDLFYYEITVVGGRIVRIDQKVALSGC